MVTLQILVLSFQVRILVAQLRQNESTRCRKAASFLFLDSIIGNDANSGLLVKIQTETKTSTNAVESAEKNKKGAFIPLGAAAIAAIGTIVKEVGNGVKK